MLKLRDAGPPRPGKNAVAIVPKNQAVTPKSKSTRAEAQESRALDMVSVVGQIMAGHKGELEIIATQMVAMMKAYLDAMKEERDRERERHKWELEDARDERTAAREAEQKRWEAEQAAIVAARRESTLRVKNWLTPEEVNEINGIPPLAVRSLARAGKLVAIGRGSELRISRASLESYQ